MIGARSAAMAFNRLIDADIDARNPRTRMAPSARAFGSRGFTWGFVAISALGSGSPSGELNPLCFRWPLVALGIVFFYSFTKRFTSFSIWCWGFALGTRPAAAWIAHRRRLSIRASCGSPRQSPSGPPVVDVIYACQDFRIRFRP